MDVEITQSSEQWMSLKDAIKPFKKDYWWLLRRVQDDRIPSRQEAPGSNYWVRSVDIKNYIENLPLSQEARANHGAA